MTWSGTGRAEDDKATTTLHQDGMTKVRDFGAEITIQGEELKAMTLAKKVVSDGTGCALKEVSS